MTDTINLTPSRAAYERRILPALKEAAARYQGELTMLGSLLSHPINLSGDWLDMLQNIIIDRRTETELKLDEMLEQINEIERYLTATPDQQP